MLVWIMAKSREILPISWCSLIIWPTLPLMLSALATMLSKLPYSLNNLTAVTSPIPGIPGRLSLASPLKPL